MFFLGSTGFGLAIIGSSVLSIFTLTIVRYLVFGTVVLTNTMIAKTLSPYTPPFGTPAWAHQFIQGTVLEPLAILIPCVVLGFFLLRISGSRAKDRLGQLVQSAKFRELPARISFGIIYYISYIAFILVFGCNYFSRPGRMGASAILALVAVAVLAIPVVRPVQSPRLRNKGGCLRSDPSTLARCRRGRHAVDATWGILRLTRR